MQANSRARTTCSAKQPLGSPAPATVRAIRRRLVAWYRRTARDLPWRRTADPYRIWLSEIMLQQTRVETVLPYYERFVQRFPAVHDLAHAKLDDVLKLWAGLGYYTRARNLHKAAQIVSSDRSGEFPTTVVGLQRLPGIGRYTAGAIASIAFCERAAVLDGNVKRVLTRLYAIEESITASATVDKLWALAEELVPRTSPGDFNQALMELGARVCTAKRPACVDCPIRPQCAAADRGIQDRLPVRGRKPAIPRITAAAAAIRRNGRFVLVQRPPTGLLGGLWKLPDVEIRNGDPHASILRDHVANTLGLHLEVGDRLGVVKHVFTHRLLELHVYACRVERGRLRGGRWAKPTQFDDHAFASVDRKALALLRD